VRAPRLLIDFAHRRAGWSLFAAVLLAAAAMAGAAFGTLLWQGQQRIDSLRAAAAALERQQRQVVVAPATITAERARAVNDAIGRLNLPWDRIFVALNAAGAQVRAGSVALLELEPDAAAGVVKITAEARSAEAMLNYQRRLEEQPAFASALMTRHEVIVEDPQAPMRFWIEAQLAQESSR
jgi:hypothetical protein